MLSTEEPFTDKLMLLMQRAEWGPKLTRACDYLLLNEADAELLCAESDMAEGGREIKRFRRLRLPGELPPPGKPPLTTHGMTFNGVTVLIAPVDAPTFVQRLAP